MNGAPRRMRNNVERRYSDVVQDEYESPHSQGTQIEHSFLAHPRDSRAPHLQKFLLVDDFHAEFLRLVEFGTGFVSGENVIGLLAHAAATSPAEGLRFT